LNIMEQTHPLNKRTRITVATTIGTANVVNGLRGLLQQTWQRHLLDTAYTVWIFNSLFSVTACSHRRRGQDKAVFCCSCRRCEQAIARLPSIYLAC